MVQLHTVTVSARGLDRCSTPSHARFALFRQERPFPGNLYSAVTQFLSNGSECIRHVRFILQCQDFASPVGVNNLRQHIPFIPWRQAASALVRLPKLESITLHVAGVADGSIWASAATGSEGVLLRESAMPHTMEEWVTSELIDGAENEEYAMYNRAYPTFDGEHQNPYDSGKPARSDATHVH